MCHQALSQYTTKQSIHFRYFYLPLIGAFQTRGIVPRLFASFSTFCFIWLWHGMNSDLFVWSSLNFIGITFEAVAREISRTRVIVDCASYVGVKFMTRFLCLLSVPLTMMSLVSQSFFLMGHESGFVMLRRLFLSPSISGTPIIILSLYCFSHVSYHSRVPE